MNYIEQLNQFWQTRRRVRLSSNEADLYYFLLNESNSRMWENPFECTNILICATIGMSEKTLIDVRNRLVQKGLISVEAGQRKKKSPIYTLLYCKKEGKNVGIEGSITDSKTVSKTPNIINKLNKTKLNKEKDTNVSKKKTCVFTPPSVQEVREYCTQRNNSVDPEKFWDFYESKGWMVGKNKMKEWMPAVRTWEKEDKSQQPKHLETSNQDGKSRLHPALQ